MNNVGSSNSSSIVQVALVQMSCDSNRAINVDKALEQIAQAAAGGAQVICLQELFHDLYPCQSEDHTNFDRAEAIPGPTSRALSEAARTHGVVVIGSVFERRAQGLYHNTALVFDVDGTRVGLYRKMHVPDDPHYYEKFYFTPGDTGFHSFATQFGRIGVAVCWDQWFPEAARLIALQGATILFYPTAIGWLPDESPGDRRGQQNAWQTMLRSHAIANGVFVAATNRVGSEENIEFWGASCIADPTGRVIAQATDDQEEIIQAGCDLQLIDAVRTHWPFLRDRRIDAYGGILARWLQDDPSESDPKDDQ